MPVVGLGPKTPIFQAKITTFLTLLKPNLTLLNLTRFNSFGVRFGVRFGKVRSAKV